MVKRVRDRVVEYRKAGGASGMDDQKMVDEYVKVMGTGGFTRRFKTYARQALSLTPNAVRMADIGTGPGFLAIELSKCSGQEVYAVDISPNMLKKASELAAARGAAIETVLADCADLPFEDRSLDLVTSANLIHMFEDITPFLTELKRVVKPGGKGLIFAFKRDVPWIFRKIVELTNITRRNSALDGFDSVINASFTGNELEQLLDKVGFKTFTVNAGTIFLEAEIGF